jgi:lipid II:glycine glycyltransferase (peptidoglycan interpeptide bridge formation enzyme)
MSYQSVSADQKARFNALATHPLQSWQWGDFRVKTGIKVLRLGEFEKEKLVSSAQLSLHPIPKLPFTIGYLPKGPLPSLELVQSLRSIGHENNCIFIKFEPNVIALPAITSQLTALSLVPSYRPLFTKYTFHLDLTQSEEMLLKNMHPKTRYNIKVAQKHGVIVSEENSQEAFSKYLELTLETTQRQKFYAHDASYHRLMWETLGPSAGNDQIAHLFTARYQGKILVTWILFLFNDVLYYPYGASSSECREAMASTAMMWETIRWGKKQNAKLFDLWGTPGPDPKPNDPYFGFHRFKLGFGPKLVEFVGSYDLPLKAPYYTLFKYADLTRWQLLKFRSKL